MTRSDVIIAVDFDGTIVDHCYPSIGGAVPDALPALRMFNALGFRLILWTMRSGDPLNDAVRFVETHGIKLWGVNNNPGQVSWTASPKVYAHYYVDDAAVGCPLKRFHGFARPAVVWREVTALILDAEFGEQASLRLLDQHEIGKVVTTKSTRQERTSKKRKKGKSQ